MSCLPRRSARVVISSVALTTLVLLGTVARARAESQCGGWAQVQVPNGLGPRSLGASAFDGSRGRMMLFGGRTLSGQTEIWMNDVWTLDLVTSTWTQLTPSGTPPRVRDTAAMIYDPVHDRMIVFGGFGALNGNDLLNDVWELTLSGTPAWNPLTPSGTAPTKRRLHSMVYDAANARALVFGGVGGGAGDLNDVWALSLNGAPAWSAPSIPGPRPAQRSGHGAIYDPQHQRMVVYGGESFGSGVMFDTWTLSLAGPLAWTQVTTAGVGHIAGYAVQAFYDPVDRQMIVHGGYSSAAISSLSLDTPTPTWTHIDAEGTPTARQYHFGVFDPTRRRLAVYGGHGAGMLGTSEAIDITRGFSIAATAQNIDAGRVTVSPSALCHAAGEVLSLTAVPNPGYEFVGWSGAVSGATNPVSFTVTGDATVVAEFAAAPPRCGSWSVLDPSLSPAGRSGPAAAIDAASDRMVMFGGRAVPGLTNEVWSLALSGAPAWTLQTPSGSAPAARDRASLVADPARNRMLLVGGVASGGPVTDLWQLDLAGGMTWAQVGLVGPWPTPRTGPSVILDPVRDRLLMFGGLIVNTTNELWELPLTGPATWSKLTLPNPPPSRFGHVAIYDPVRDRMIVFGGSTSGGVVAYQDVWALDLAGSPAWSPLAPHGVPPDSTVHASASYDAANDRMLVVGGGRTASVGASDLTFALSLDVPAWTRLTPVSPPAGRQRHAAVVDGDHGRIIVFGGQNQVGSPIGFPTQFTLEGGLPLDLSVDHPQRGRVTALTEPDCHPLHSSVRIAAEPANGYAFAGWQGDASGTENPLTVQMNRAKSIVATFEFAGVSCSGWTLAGTAPQPAPRASASAMWDPVRGRMLMFGGLTGGGVVNDVWAVDPASAQWSTIVPQFSPPFAREGACVAYDSVRDRMLLLGGVYGSAAHSDFWALTLSGSPQWLQRPAQYTPARRYASLIYDPVRDRLLMFGGSADAVSPTNEVWALPLGGAGTPQWSQISVSGGPAARHGHGAIYDPVRDRLVVFGGSGAAGARLNDTWALTLAGVPQWTQLPGQPGAGGFGTHVGYDPARDRLVVFGGQIGGPSSPTDDAYALSFATLEWTPVEVGTTLPSARSRGAAAFDPTHDRFIVFGGQNSGNALIGEPAVLSFESGNGIAATASPLEGGVVLQSPSAECHAAGSEVTLHAIARTGYAFTGWSGDASGSTNPLVITAASSLNIVANFASAPVSVDDVAIATGLTSIAPNPAFGMARVSYAVAADADVRVELIDVLGRRVATLVSGRHAPGRYTIPFEARRAGAARIPAGVYFVRFDAGGVRSVKRVVLAR